jgi:DNA-binding transcriptional regulator YiaG
MASVVLGSMAARHLLSSEMPDPQMAKANLRKTETRPWNERVGRAVERIRTLTGLSLKEFSAAIDREPRQVARWIDGTENPQFAAMFSVDAFRLHVVHAIAELAEPDGVEIEYSIRFPNHSRRTA